MNFDLGASGDGGCWRWLLLWFVRATLITVGKCENTTEEHDRRRRRPYRMRSLVSSVHLCWREEHTKNTVDNYPSFVNSRNSCVCVYTHFRVCLRLTGNLRDHSSPSVRTMAQMRMEQPPPPPPSSSSSSSPPPLCWWWLSSQSEFGSRKRLWLENAVKIV